MGNFQPGPAHRSFILIGRVANGKSSLGNLLLDDGSDEPFKIHEEIQEQCLTKCMEYSQTRIKSSLIYGDKVPEEYIRIQVIDQPGLGDPEYSLENYSQFLMDCLRTSNAEMSTTFLITIKMTSDLITEQTVSNLFDLSYFMAKFKYNFFRNALVVFTHVDRVKLKKGTYQDIESLDEKLKELMQDESWNLISEILQRVDNRHVFVNSWSREPGYRDEVLRNLFEVSKPVIKATFHGNRDFTGAEMQTFLKDNNNQSITHPRCHLQCTFSQDFQSGMALNLESEVISSINRLKEIGHGISVVVILISLHRDLSEQLHELINALPKDYKIGEERETEFWKYTFIVFKLDIDVLNPVEFIDTQLQSLDGIREIYERCGRRSIWVTKGMSNDECVNRILEMSQSIKQCNEGREYINAEIVTNMRQKIDKMKIEPPPQIAGATNQSSQPITDIIATLGVSMFNFALKVATPDPGSMRRKIEYKYKRIITDEEFKYMLEHLEL